MAPHDDLTAERAAIKLYEKILSYSPDPEALNAGDDKDFEAIMQALKTARQEALRELRERLEKREQFYTEQEAQSEGQMRLTRGIQRNEASGCIAELDRLASEGG